MKDYVLKGVIEGLRGGNIKPREIPELMMELEKVWGRYNEKKNELHFYHKDSGEFYGPGSWSSAYAYFREKYPRAAAMTEESFIFAPTWAELYQVVRAG
jgi:hypothetical protein